MIWIMDLTNIQVWFALVVGMVIGGAMVAFTIHKWFIDNDDNE